MFIRVISPCFNACEEAALKVFQANQIPVARRFVKHNDAKVREGILYLIVGESEQSFEQSAIWTRMKSRRRLVSLSNYQPFIEAVTKLAAKKQSLKNADQRIERTLQLGTDLLNGLAKAYRMRRNEWPSSEEVKEVESELSKLLQNDERFASKKLTVADLSSLQSVLDFRSELNNAHLQISQEQTEKKQEELRSHSYAKRKAKKVPRGLLLATSTDIFAQAVRILDTASLLQIEMGAPVTHLSVRILTDTWRDVAGKLDPDAAVTDVEYFFERMIDAMGDHLFQKPEAGKRTRREVNPASSSVCFGRLHAIRVQQYRNELFQWIGQLPLDTISRRRIRKYCEGELEPRLNAVAMLQDATASATDKPDFLLEKLIIEGVQALSPKTFRKYRRSFLGRSTTLKQHPRDYLEMFCNNYRGIGYGSVNLSDIRDQLLKSHPSKDRYLRTIALLLLGGIVPKKDEAAYKQILLAQQEWEFLDARFAKSGPISFFQRMGGWRHLVSLGTNTHYSRREDPFLKDNPAIGPKTFLRSERLRADLFYFIDEICRNPDECQPTKIVAFARNIASLCGTDPDQWRTWLGPPEVWLRKT